MSIEGVRRSIEGITHKMLSQELRELERIASSAATCTQSCYPRSNIL
jgi:DNA-binding HxlR family transcriptional regulator